MFVMNDVFTVELVQMKLLLLLFKLKFFHLDTYIARYTLRSFASFCNLIAIKILLRCMQRTLNENSRWKFMRIMDMDSSDKILVIHNIQLSYRPISISHATPFYDKHAATSLIFYSNILI